MTTLYNIEYAKLFLLPKSADVVSTGIVLYVLGISSSFIYFSEFNILSVDFLKPQAIILGLYIWSYSILFPRILLLITLSITKGKYGWLSFILFVVFLILLNFSFLLLLGYSIFYIVITGFLFTLIILVFHFDFCKQKIVLQPTFTTNCFLLIFMTIFFSYLLFPRIPHRFGGGKPLKVNVVTDDTTLLKSRFSKSIYLLYESESDLYFLEKKTDANTELIYNYLIKRIRKSDVKKIEFEKSIWQTF